MVRLIPLALLLAAAAAVTASTTSTHPRTTRTVYVTVTASAEGDASTPIDAGADSQPTEQGDASARSISLPAVYDGLTFSGTLSTPDELDELEFTHPGMVSAYAWQPIFVDGDGKRYWALGGEVAELMRAIQARRAAIVPNVGADGEGGGVSGGGGEGVPEWKRAFDNAGWREQERDNRDKRQTDPKAAEAYRKQRAEMWADRRAAVAGDWDRIGLGDAQDAPHLRDEL